MTNKLSSFWIVLIIAAFAGWQIYQVNQRVSGMGRVSGMECAEFRIAYSDARNGLDAYSGCQSATDAAKSGQTIDIQIELQKQFAALRQKISDSGFAEDQKVIDLEIQVRDRNPQTRMEDRAVRCARLSPLGLLKQADVTSRLSSLDTFLKKY